MTEVQEPKILFEDGYLLIVEKPAGVLSVPDRYNPLLHNLKDSFDKKYGKIFIVHRLDKETAGVMVFAKDADTHKNLNDQFQNFKVTKIYHSLWSGIVSKDEMLIDIPLMSDPAKKGKTIPSARGKESYSKIKVIERFRIATLVEIELLTGRHHQIRAHAAAVGHPLLVDEMYGGGKAFYLSDIKKKYNIRKEKEERPLISRITLHSYSLTVLHPISGEDITCTTEYPKDFDVTLKKLKKYSVLPEYYVGSTEL